MKLFGRKSEKPAPTPPQPAKRTEPLLVILDNYVLDCIGELPAEGQEAFREVVQKALGGDDDWKETVRRQLELGDQLDDHLKEMWVQNQEIFRKAGKTLSPEQFARMVVDKNFVPMLK